MVVTAYKLTWFKSFMASPSVFQKQPMRFFCDNQAALHIASNLVFHERTKNIEVDCHYMREQLLTGNITTYFIRSSQQLTDLFI